jgi:hypothetical protein
MTLAILLSFSQHLQGFEILDLGMSDEKCMKILSGSSDWFAAISASLLLLTISYMKGKSPSESEFSACLSSQKLYFFEKSEFSFIQHSSSCDPF